MDISARIRTLKATAQTEAKAARDIVDRAEAQNRDLTQAERKDFDEHMTKARHGLDSLKQAQADQEFYDQTNALNEEINRPRHGTRRKAGRTSPWAKTAADRVTRAMITTIDGQKALVSGSIGVPSVIETDVITIPDAPRSLLDLIPVKPLGSDGFGTGNTFTFLRQTVRDHQADVVADGALKPTSNYTLEEVEDKVHVLATLSEPTPERYFADHSNLEDFLASEMGAGLLLALETQVLSGDGTGENLTGVLETSGIQTQAFATDILTSIRKGLTKLQQLGVEPTALVLNPTDLEALDLLREDGATGGFLLGSPDGAEAANIWRVPRVPSVAVTAGTAILADWNQAEVVVREGATLALDRSGENFTKNLVTMRLEGRFGFAVKRPLSFVEIDLAA